MPGFGEFRIFSKELFRVISRILKYLCILEYIGDLEIQYPALADSEHVSRSPKPQVFSGDQDSVVRMVQDIQPFPGLVRL